MQDEEFEFMGYPGAKGLISRLRSKSAGHATQAAELDAARRRAVTAVAAQLRAEQAYEADLAVVRSASAQTRDRRTAR